MSDQNDKLKNLKTSSVDRRLSIAKASLLAGTRWATASATSIFSSEEEKEKKRKKAMAEQAQYLVSEIGKLKGSIVKIGQMMALYGEHFLPEEITQALNTLNNQTIALAWPAIKAHLQEQLGSKLDELTIDHEPIGTASLAQVHRATRKSDGLELVLKIQYPGVAEAIDSDMNLFRNMLKLTRMVPQTREFDQWFDEVPEIVDEFCAKKVLCMTFERGVPVNSPVMLSLPQERRNKLGEASLEIAVRELFEWGEMQTDPNFGNYLVRLGNGDDVNDKIVLLDFGAIRQFDENLLTVARNLIHAGYNHNKDEMVKAMTGYEFFDAMPESIKPGMADVFLIATEAFSCPANNPDMPAGVMDEQDRYDWKKSQLHSRVMQQAAQSMASRYFSVPPKEFMFISRKFIGAYTFMTVIEAKTNVRKMIREFA